MGPQGHVKRQLLATAVDDMLHMIAVAEGRALVDGAEAAAAKWSAIRVTQEPDEDEVHDFWRRYASVVVRFAGGDPRSNSTTPAKPERLTQPTRLHPRVGLRSVVSWGVGLSLGVVVLLLADVPTQNDPPAATFEQQAAGATPATGPALTVAYGRDHPSLWTLRPRPRAEYDPPQIEMGTN